MSQEEKKTTEFSNQLDYGPFHGQSFGLISSTASYPSVSIEKQVGHNFLSDYGSYLFGRPKVHTC